MTNGPIFIDLEHEEPAKPEAAPAVPDLVPMEQGAAMQQVAALAARRPSKIARWFWSITLSLLVFIVSLAAWDYVNALLARSPILGGIASLLIGLLVFVLLVLAVRELAAFGRLRKLDTIQRQAAEALDAKDLKAARTVIGSLNSLYANREDTAWARTSLAERQADILDADGLLGLAENILMAPLDARAAREVEAAARQVATVTAVVPLALADVFTALTSNLRMIRRIAEVYGGRAGTLGSWRLTRSVLTHLVATGAVAVGDDLISSVAGGGVLSKISRKFGEGVVNGALTARVGVAAIEVCRPLPFHATQKPSVTGLVRRALTGLFGRD
ncbi:YcjF family protein [Yoonia sediminilitoris]|uniref:Putative membrane protein n=1 Tax=Yoonia sediminilitoris TaxID=1286148 RepID=A0A2T6KM55_9RHOB|nr:TIGR01620 family protein [Yoonia sediminilitoris]PUB17300.1 putative membrane protein [Yoonia sediminilitoris]RCW97595.1 putative membrane protein [Yoonia sediminilitoris]